MALARNLVGYAPSVILPRLITLLQVTLLTRYLPQTEFGRFVLVITVGDALDALCCNWIRIVLARYGAGRSQETLAAEAGRAYATFGGAVLLVAFPAAFVMAHWQASHVLPYFGCVAAYLVTNGLCRISLTMLALRDRKMSLLIVEALRTGLGFAVVMGLAIPGVTHRFVPLIMAMNAATACAAVLGTIYSVSGLGVRLPRSWRDGRLHYCLPLIAAALIGVALNSSDRMVTEASAGPAALAIYAAAVTLARQPLEFIFSVVNARTFPELMEAYESGGPEAGGERLADLISIMALLAVPAALGLALVAGPLARTFLSPSYVETARLVIPLGACAGLLVGFKMFVFDQTFHMAKKVWRNIFATFPVALVGMGLTALLASRFGALGCVVAVLLQYAAALTVSIVQASRLIPIRVHRADLGRIGLMAAVMTVAVTAVLSLTAGWPAALQLLAAILTGAVSYGASGWLLKPQPVLDLLPRRFVQAT